MLRCRRRCRKMATMMRCLCWTVPHRVIMTTTPTRRQIAKGNVMCGSAQKHSSGIFVCREALLLGRAGWICRESAKRGLHACGVQCCNGLPAERHGAACIGGKARGTAAAEAPASRGGPGCVHTHMALVGPAPSLAGLERRDDATAVPTPVVSLVSGAILSCLFSDAITPGSSGGGHGSCRFCGRQR